MTNQLGLCGRVELAGILGISENSARALERAGAIAPVGYAGRRPLFSVQQAQALRASRDVIEAAKRAQKIPVRTDAQVAA